MSQFIDDELGEPDTRDDDIVSEQSFDVGRYQAAMRRRAQEGSKS